MPRYVYTKYGAGSMRVMFEQPFNVHNDQERNCMNVENPLCWIAIGFI